MITFSTTYLKFFFFTLLWKKGGEWKRGPATSDTILMISQSTLDTSPEELAEKESQQRRIKRKAHNWEMLLQFTGPYLILPKLQSLCPLEYFRQRKARERNEWWWLVTGDWWLMRWRGRERERGRKEEREVWRLKRQKGKSKSECSGFTSNPPSFFGFYFVCFLSLYHRPYSSIFMCAGTATLSASVTGLTCCTLLSHLLGPQV